MSPIYRDLLSGKAGVGRPMLSGQWVVDTADLPVEVNGIRAQYGDRVIGKGDGSWSIAASAPPIEGMFHTPLPVAPSDLEALKQLEDMLSKLTTWKQWTTQSPLVPKLEEQIQIGPFDRLLEERLVFLEEVFRLPRQHLKIETDLRRVSRARRIATKAIARLASHPEDSERPTVLGIQPKRILCLILDEELDIYENRVAVRLVDHIRAYLSNRLSRLQSVLNMIEEADHSNESTEAHHWQVKRLYSIWAEVMTDDSARRTAEATRDRLDKLNSRVLSLLDTHLYSAIPRTTRVSGLRYTNIFTNDPNYRQVAAIWERWERAGHSRRLSDRQRYDGDQQVCRGLALFSRLLVLRALDQLGFMPKNGDHALIQTAAGSITLFQREIEVEISWHRDGELCVKSAGKAIRIVALPQSISVRSVPEMHIEETRSAIRRDAADSDCASVAVFHLPPMLHGTQTESAMHDESAPLLDAWHPSPGVHSEVAAVPVSPWSISSVERVARYLRWHLYSPQLQRFPPPIAIPNLFEIQLPKWLRPQQAKTGWSMLQIPTSRDKSISEFTRDYEIRLMQEFAARGGKAAQKAKGDASERAKELRSHLEIAKSMLESLAICPICKTDGASLSPQGTHAFVATCERCAACWGVHACGGAHSAGRSCGAPIPFIQADGFDDWFKGQQAYSVRTCATRFGADLLSIPLRDESGKPMWRCGKCASAELRLKRKPT